MVCQDLLMVVFLDKMNELNITSNLMPFRVISPPPIGQSSQGVGPEGIAMQTGISKFAKDVKSALSQYKSDPTKWHMLSHPVSYQEFGGDLKKFATVELMNFYTERAMVTIGIPQVFYNANTATQPLISFKMFEKSWESIGINLDEAASWIVSSHATLKDWGVMSAKLKRISLHADERQLPFLQEMYQIGQISKDTYMSKFGVDYEAEQKMIREEQLRDAKANAEFEKTMRESEMLEQIMAQKTPAQMKLEADEAAQQQQGGGGEQPAPGGGGGGQPAPGGGASGAPSSHSSIDGLVAEATQKAQEILLMPAYNRNSTLRQLKHQNEALHAQVKAELEKLEQMAGAQGVQMARQGQM